MISLGLNFKPLLEEFSKKNLFLNNYNQPKAIMDQIPMFNEDTEGLKRYYSIKEVAEMLNLSKSQIRFWEKEFDFFRPHKTSKGIRLFTKENIHQLQLIVELIRNRGFTIAGAKQEIQRRKNISAERKVIIERLENVKKLLIQLKGEI